jgi:hypothetical protein
LREKLADDGVEVKAYFIIEVLAGTHSVPPFVDGMHGIQRHNIK